MTNNEIIIITLLIILLIILLIFLLTKLFLWIYQNPSPTLSSNSENKFNKKSIVTMNNIGNRGDMGNQLFQIACLASAAERSNADYYLPTKINELPISKLFDFSDQKIKDFKPDKLFREFDNYENIVIPNDGKVYNIEGYRQTFLYFKDNEANVNKIFKLNKEIDRKFKEAVNVNEAYLCIHIRKGDYIQNKHKFPFMQEFTRCEIEYYHKACQFLKSKRNYDKIIVCTDSPNLVKPDLKLIDEKAELSSMIEGISPKFSDFLYIYYADAIVISNSTYSWWGSYLNNTDGHKMVVSPYPWWDQRGFIGSSVKLNTFHLHYPTWYVLHAYDGRVIKEADDYQSVIYKRYEHKLDIVRLFQGMFV